MKSRVARMLPGCFALTFLVWPLQGSAQSLPSLAPAGWDSAIRLVEAGDRNPDPTIVEIDLTAQVADVQIAPGKTVHAWTYNAGLPGPFIRARVGDRLVVHFKNDLPDPTTVHWHGVRVPIEMDGVPGISQDEVKRGESFTYDFILRDAGLYWYHPHVMSAKQVRFGLYGALLVEDPADGVAVADELTLVLSDIGFNAQGELEPADSEGSAGMVFGREGSFVLVKGKQQPTLRARSGAPQRWRIVNAAKSRFFLLELEGQLFTTIGGDGGLQERAVTDEAVLITPGERLDVIVTPTGAPGSMLVLRALLYNRGYGSIEYRNVEPLLTIAISDQPTLAKRALPNVSRSIPAPTTAGPVPVDLVLTLPPVDFNRHSGFRVNGVQFGKARPFLAKLGETELWTVKNDTQWDHPFHLHGCFFIVLDEKGAPVRPLAWKDTINIPMNSIARFLVTFDERPGTWMFHCHILDHADGGLMGIVRVGETPTVDHVHTKKP